MNVVSGLVLFWLFSTQTSCGESNGLRNTEQPKDELELYPEKLDESKNKRLV